MVSFFKSDPEKEALVKELREVQEEFVKLVPPSQPLNQEKYLLTRLGLQEVRLAWL